MSSAERSAKAKLQPRDRLGRWISVGDVVLVKRAGGREGFTAKVTKAMDAEGNFTVVKTTGGYEEKVKGPEIQKISATLNAEPSVFKDAPRVKQKATPIQDVKAGDSFYIYNEDDFKVHYTALAAPGPYTGHNADQFGEGYYSLQARNERTGATEKLDFGNGFWGGTKVYTDEEQPAPADPEQLPRPDGEGADALGPEVTLDEYGRATQKMSTLGPGDQFITWVDAGGMGDDGQVVWTVEEIEVGPDGKATKLQAKDDNGRSFDMTDWFHGDSVEVNTDQIEKRGAGKVGTDAPAAPDAPAKWQMPKASAEAQAKGVGIDGSEFANGGRNGNQVTADSLKRSLAQGTGTGNLTYDQLYRIVDGMYEGDHAYAAEKINSGKLPIPKNVAPSGRRPTQPKGDMSPNTIGKATANPDSGKPSGPIAATPMEAQRGDVFNGNKVVSRISMGDGFSLMFRSPDGEMFTVDYDASGRAVNSTKKG